MILAETRYLSKFKGTFEPFYNRVDNVVMYRKIHYWMWRYKIQAHRCKCGSTDNMNMSLKRGKPYDFDINNFEPLCNSCNQKQDWTLEKKIRHKARTKDIYASPEYRKRQSETVKKAWADGKYKTR